MLSQLVTIKNEIDRVLSTPKLSPDDRVKVLNLLHSRFDHIYKVLKYDGLAPLPPPAAGGLQIAAPALHSAAGVPAAGVPAAGVPAGLGAMPAAFIPIQLAAPPIGALPAAVDAPDDEFGPIADADAHGVDADLGVEPKGIEVAVGPDVPISEGTERGVETELAVVWPTKQQMGIPQNMEPKYKQFTAKLSLYPHLINRTQQNEIVINGERIEGSNFSDLIGSLYRRNSQLTLKGETDFIKLLRSMESHLMRFLLGSLRNF